MIKGIGIGTSNPELFAILPKPSRYQLCKAGIHPENEIFKKMVALQCEIIGKKSPLLGIGQMGPSFYESPPKTSAKKIEDKDVLYWEPNSIQKNGRPEWLFILGAKKIGPQELVFFTITKLVSHPINDAIDEYRDSTITPIYMVSFKRFQEKIVCLYPPQIPLLSVPTHPTVATNKNLPKEKGSYTTTINGIKNEFEYFDWGKTAKCIQTFPDSTIVEKTYVNGLENGPAIQIDPDKSIMKFEYVNGKRQGKASKESLEGTIIEFFYENGDPDGPAIQKNKDFTIEFNYSKGTRVGPARKIYNESGLIVEFTY